MTPHEEHYPRRRAPDDGNNWGPAKPNAHLAYPEEMSLRPDAFPDMCYEFSSVD
jgi:hypothetical protein